MAKKKSTAQKVENRSVRANMNALIGLCSCIAIVLSVVITIVTAIMQWANASATIGGKDVVSILKLIELIALNIAVCLGAYYYARNKVKWFKITVFVAIIISILLAIIFGILTL